MKHLDFADIVRSSYNANAHHYANRTGMQSQNLLNLVASISSDLDFLNDKNILDIGCGFGNFYDYLSEQAAGFSYTGIDLSEELIKQAAKRHPLADFRVSDAQRFDYPSAAFDVVFSNSVLHWNNVPEFGKTIDPIIKHTHDSLKPGGKLAISISGAGTASLFIKAYHQIVKAYEQRSELLDYSMVRKDPIGSMHLCEVISVLKKYGFVVESGRNAFEPVTYDNAFKYSEDVYAYGYEPYMYPFKERKIEIWGEIVDAFCTLVGDGAYVHDQYMIYIVARKKS